MKARFSISASITPPGTYGTEGTATHSGDLHFDGTKGDPFDKATAHRALAALDARWSTIRLEIEASLLAYAAEKEKEAADLAAKQAKIVADQEEIAALYSSPSPDDDIPI